MPADHRDPAALAAALERLRSVQLWGPFGDDVALVAAAVTALSEQHARALAILAQIRWCPMCAPQDDPLSHVDGCLIGEALDALRAAAAGEGR